MSERALRSDAARNRAHILEVARAAFAADGPAVSLDEIARLAGVGAGTVHRHFPTKESLLTAVVVDRLEGLAALADRASTRPDADAAFFEFLTEMTAEAAQNQVLTVALGGNIGEVASSAGAALSVALGVLLDRAKAAGAVRIDITQTDIHAILTGVIAMERALPESRRGLGLNVVLDGLRPS
jgi:AcrR family transcriptional regulator